MARFSVKIDVEPEDIPKLDDAHKRDCADAINKVINKTFKYTAIFTIAVAAYYGAYSLFAFPYLMRMGKLLPQMNALIPILAVATFLFEFIAGTMKRWALALCILFQLITAVISVTQLQTMPIFPFAIYAIFLHINLFGYMPHYDVISKLKGFPDFTPLPIGDVIKKVPKEENASDKAEKPAEDKEQTPVTEDEKVPVKEEKITEADNKPSDVRKDPNAENTVSETDDTAERSKKKRKGKK